MSINYLYRYRYVFKEMVHVCYRKGVHNNRVVVKSLLEAISKRVRHAATRKSLCKLCKNGFTTPIQIKPHCIKLVIIRTTKMYFH